MTRSRARPRSTSGGQVQLAVISVHHFTTFDAFVITRHVQYLALCAQTFVVLSSTQRYVRQIVTSASQIFPWRVASLISRKFHIHLRRESISVKPHMLRKLLETNEAGLHRCAWHMVYRFTCRTIPPDRRPIQRFEKAEVRRQAGEEIITEAPVLAQGRQLHALDCVVHMPRKLPVTNKPRLLRIALEAVQRVLPPRHPPKNSNGLHQEVTRLCTSSRLRSAASAGCVWCYSLQRMVLLGAGAHSLKDLDSSLRSR